MDEMEPCKVHWCLAKKPGREYELMATKGICLEEVGIPSVGHVVINRTIKPKVGDIVWCNDWRCCISGYLKQVKSFDGNEMIVTTRYKDHVKDFSFYVFEFYGVVELAFDQRGKICYRRPELGVTTSMGCFKSAEPRLIDANAMRADWLENGENEYVYDTNAVLDSIDAQPTVDAVPVVRCKDCKQWQRNCGRTDSPNGHCFLHDIDPNGNDFCSNGERRDND